MVKDSQATKFKWKVENGAIAEMRNDTLIVIWNNAPDTYGNVTATSIYANGDSLSKTVRVSLAKSRLDLVAPKPIGDTLVIAGRCQKYTYEAPYSPDYSYR